MSTSSSSDSDSGSDFQGTWTVREDFIEKAVKAELKKFKVQRLNITFDKTTPQYVRIHKKMFYYTLYVSVGITISPSILLWKDVPQTDITSILDRLETKFVYPRDNPIVMDEIEALMRKALHDRRNEMKVWWMKNVVELGLEKANRKPYMGVMMGDWIPLTHFFNSNQPQKNEMASHKRAFQLVSTAESGASCKGGDEAIGEKRAIDLSGQKDLVKDLKGSRESYQDLRERSKAMYSFTLTMYQHMQQLTKFVPGFKFELPPPPPPLPDSPDYTTKRKKLHSPDSSDSSSDEDDEDPSVNDI
uniref:Uncharacterized protein n=1 Tax=Cannabis sativa TaxID=3483 RepID=A0A803P6G6_CANSA